MTVAGLVLEIRKRGNRNSFILDDRSGRLEVTMFEDVYQQYRSVVTKDAILVVEGGLRWDDFIDDWRIGAKKIMDVDQAREQFARNLVLRWPAARARNGDASKLIAALEQALQAEPGRRAATWPCVSPPAKRLPILTFGEQWKVRPSRELIERLGIAGRPRRCRAVLRRHATPDLTAQPGGRLRDELASLPRIPCNNSSRPQSRTKSGGTHMDIDGWLKELRVPREAYRVVSLLPLVYVAWADGKIQNVRT